MVKPKKKYKARATAAFMPGGSRKAKPRRPRSEKPWSEFSGSTDENFARMRQRASEHKSDRGAKYASGTSNMGLFEQGRSFLGPYVGQFKDLAYLLAWQEANKQAYKSYKFLERHYKSFGEDAKRWFGGITGLGSRETGATPDLALYSAQVAPPMMNAPNSLGLAGEMYNNRWHIDDGPHDKTLATAVNLYKERTMTLWETNYVSPNWFNSQIAQAGINRRGWYAPWKGAGSTPDYITTNYSDGGVYKNGGIYDSVGVLGLRHMYNFIRENLSADVLNYMAEQNTSNSDLLFPITRTRSTHRICNNLTESEVEISAYLLKARQPSQGHPLGDMFNFGIAESISTTWPTDLAPQQGGDGPYYWQGKKTGVLVGLPGNPAENAPWDGENTTCPGVTPFLSPRFRTNWEVMDVMHQRLQPADTWQLCVERKFRHPVRWNFFKGELGYASDTNFDMPDPTLPKVANYYRTGDYEVLFSFSGLPGMVSGWQTGEVSGNDETDVEIASLAPRNVDCKRSRISKTVHHEVSAAWPTLVLKGQQPTTGSDELIENTFITATQRLPDSALASATFSRAVTIPGTTTVVQVDNWPAIGSNDAPPRVGTAKVAIEGTPIREEL